MKSLATALLAALLSVSLSQAVFAADAQSTVSAPAAASKGEIKKVNQEAGTLTIKHGELANLKMPAMTMVFEVADKAVLAKLKTGDKITFVANNANGQLTASNVTPVE